MKHAAKLEYKKYTALDNVLWQAEDFLRAYEVIKTANDLEEFADRIPKVVNAHIPFLAFAIELLLKSLHYYSEIEVKKIHELDKLYHKLPKDLRYRINVALSERRPLTRFDLQSKSFVSDVDYELKKNGKAFVKWRYAFDNQESAVLNFSTGFCEDFAYSVLQVANDLKAESGLYYSR